MSKKTQERIRDVRKISEMRAKREGTQEWIKTDYTWREIED